MLFNSLDHVILAGKQPIWNNQGQVISLNDEDVITVRINTLVLAQIGQLYFEEVVDIVLSSTMTTNAH